MTALETAKTMAPDAAREKLAQNGIVLTQNEKLVAAIANCDAEGTLLTLLRQNAEKVFAGMYIAAYAAGAQAVVLKIPDFAPELRTKIAPAAAKQGILLENGIVDVRAERGSCCVTLDEASDIADVFAGNFVPGRYLSVNGAPLARVPLTACIADLADWQGCTAIEIGCAFYLPAAAQQTVGDFDIPNGIVRALTAKQCIVAETEKRLMAYRKISCGKCVFCREGLVQLQGFAREIEDGRGKPEYPALCREIGEPMAFSTLCSIGQESEKILLSALELFPEEWEKHIRKKQCTAGVCFSAERLYIDPMLCTGCGDCIDCCPEDCIEGRSGYIHMIDTMACTRCGKCAEACGENAVVRTAGRLPRLPERLVKAGRFKKY